MNLLILAGFGCGTIALLWIAQSLSLRATGKRNIWILPYRHESESSLVRWCMKLALHVGLLSMIFLYPWVIGFDPWQYHLERTLPLDWKQAATGLAIAVCLLSLPLVISVSVGWVKFENRYKPAKLIYKIARSFLIPLPLTLVEEPLFRGVIQDQLLKAFPADLAGTAVAIVVVVADLRDGPFREAAEAIAAAVYRPVRPGRAAEPGVLAHRPSLSAADGHSRQWRLVCANYPAHDKVPGPLLADRLLLLSHLRRHGPDIHGGDVRRGDDGHPRLANRRGAGDSPARMVTQPASQARESTPSFASVSG